MLLLAVFTTISLLVLFAIGQLLPNNVFLGPKATRQKVIKFYGIPALLGFIGLMVFAPKDQSSKSQESAPNLHHAGSEPFPEKGRVLSKTFMGFALPGRMNDAKSTGFTDCSADYYGYKCKRTTLTQMFGLKAQSAELLLDGRDYFSDAFLTPLGRSGDVRQFAEAELAYGEVVLTFERDEYDLKCVERHRAKTGAYDRPASCITNANTIGQLNQALLDAGWVMTPTKGGYLNYVHPTELVEITTKHQSAAVHRISAEIVKDLVARDTTLRAASEAAAKNGARIVEQMKR